MWEKLKHEWKTAVLAVSSLLIGVWDAGASVLDWTPLVSDRYKPYVPLVLGTAFLILRRWTPQK